MVRKNSLFIGKTQDLNTPIGHCSYSTRQEYVH